MCNKKNEENTEKTNENRIIEIKMQGKKDKENNRTWEENNFGECYKNYTHFKFIIYSYKRNCNFVVVVCVCFHDKKCRIAKWIRIFIPIFPSFFRWVVHNETHYLRFMLFKLFHHNIGGKNNFFFILLMWTIGKSSFFFFLFPVH